MSFNHLYSYNGVFLKRFSEIILLSQTNLNLYCWQSILLQQINSQPDIHIVTSRKMIELDPFFDLSNNPSNLSRSQSTNWPGQSVPVQVNWQPRPPIWKRISSDLYQTHRSQVGSIANTTCEMTRCISSRLGEKQKQWRRETAFK
jgi:hypothetical protein